MTIDDKIKEMHERWQISDKELYATNNGIIYLQDKTLSDWHYEMWNYICEQIEEILADVKQRKDVSVAFADIVTLKNEFAIEHIKDYKLLRMLDCSSNCFACLYNDIMRVYDRYECECAFCPLAKNPENGCLDKLYNTILLATLPIQLRIAKQIRDLYWDWK